MQKFDFPILYSITFHTSGYSALLTCSHLIIFFLTALPEVDEEPSDYGSIQSGELCGESNNELKVSKFIIISV